MSRSFRHIEQGEGAAKAASFSTPAGFTDRFAQAWRTRSEALDARKHWLEEELRHDGQTEPAWKLACVQSASATSKLDQIEAAILELDPATPEEACAQAAIALAAGLEDNGHLARGIDKLTRRMIARFDPQAEWRIDAFTEPMH